MERATFSLEKDNYTFLNKVGGENKSAYINRLLQRAKYKALEEAVLKANKEESDDSDYQEELSSWDTTLLDGLSK
jgi:antitoxin CcdA